MQRIVTRLVWFYTKSLEIAIAFLLTEMVLVGFAAVISRYLLSRYVSLYWAEELIRYSFIWATFLVSPLVIRRGAKMELDLLLKRFPPPLQRLIAILNSLMILGFLGVLVVQGVVMTRVNLTYLSAGLEIPMAWIYLAIPLGGLLMAGEYVVVLARAWRGEVAQ